jgi:hypothetical protein
VRPSFPLLLAMQTPSLRRRFINRAFVRRLAAWSLLAPVLLVGCSKDKPTQSGSGSMRVSVSGLAGGAQARITVSGPGGYSTAVTSTTHLQGIPSGRYSVTADDVTSPEVFVPTPRTQQVTVGSQEVIAAIAYEQITGALIVQIQGVPAGGAPEVRVTGPGGFERVITSTTSLQGLTPGEYQVAASHRRVGSCLFRPEQENAAVTVSVAQVKVQPINYSASGGTEYNMCVQWAYLVQSVQDPGGGVPLIAGRDALVRVFVRGSAPTNDVRPQVRVRIFQGGSVIHTTMLSLAAQNSIPTEPFEDNLGRSFNGLIPGSVLQPGVSMLAEVDPANAFPDADPGDNLFPHTGTPLPLDVRTVRPIRMRFVPITQSDNSTGSIAASNLEQYTRLTEAMLPLGNSQSEIAAPFAVGGAAVTSNNSNQSWQRILRDLEIKRAAEVEPGAPMHYIGVLATSYNSGVAGMAYVPGLSMLVWDKYSTGSSAAVLAHELGHNFGRMHVAGCQNPTGLDNMYPYHLGRIGVFGFDLLNGMLYTPDYADVMSYCNSVWISDYNYTRMMEFRGFDGQPSIVSGSAIEDVMIVSGVVRNGRVELDPTFVTRGYAAMPPGRGRYRLDGLDAAGQSLFSFTFEPRPVADLPQLEHHFVYAVPLRGAARDRVESLRSSGPSGVSSRSLPRGPRSALGQAVLRRSGTGRIAVQWDRAVHAELLVRDARTGEVIAIARGGNAEVLTSAADVDLVASDAPRTAPRRVAIHTLQ